MRKNKSYSKEQKEEIISEIYQGQKTKAQICREYEISSSTMWEWLKKYEAGTLFNSAKESNSELIISNQKIAQLEQKVGQQALEIDLLKKAKKISEQMRREELSRKRKWGLFSGGVK